MMIDIIILELLAVISLLYSILLMFITFAPNNQIFIIFAWTLLATTVFALISQRYKILEISILLLLLPLIFYNNTIAVYFFLMTTVLIYLYTKKSLLQGRLADYVINLKRSLFLYFAAASIRYLVFHNIGETVGYASPFPFIIIYFLSTVILIRSIRHLDSGMDIKRIQRTNIIYLIMMTSVLFITTFDAVRTFFISVIVKIPEIIFYPIHLLLTLVEILAELLAKWNNSRETSGLIDQVLTEILPVEIIEEVVEGDYIYIGTSILEKIFMVLLIVAVIFLIYQFIIKVGDRNFAGVDYTEEREYIRDKKVKKKWYSRDPFPSDFRSQIRYYYRKYLNKLGRNNVIINVSDTSLEVNIKAEEVFPAGAERLRAIYIDSRYGNRDVDLRTVQEIAKMYKEL